MGSCPGGRDDDLGRSRRAAERVTRMFALRRLRAAMTISADHGAPPNESPACSHSDGCACDSRERVRLARVPMTRQQRSALYRGIAAERREVGEPRLPETQVTETMAIHYLGFNDAGLHHSRPALVAVEGEKVKPVKIPRFPDQEAVISEALEAAKKNIGVKDNAAAWVEIARAAIEWEESTNKSLDYYRGAGRPVSATPNGGAGSGS